MRALGEERIAIQGAIIADAARHALGAHGSDELLFADAQAGAIEAERVEMIAAPGHARFRLHDCDAGQVVQAVIEQRGIACAARGLLRQARQLGRQQRGLKLGQAQIAAEQMML
ncbi:MAG: hypothetical protein NTV22_06445, partial [bacterium]|nr:hypothetical protein [bacterium]